MERVHVRHVFQVVWFVTPRQVAPNAGTVTWLQGPQHATLAQSPPARPATLLALVQVVLPIMFCSPILVCNVLCQTARGATQMANVSHAMRGSSYLMGYARIVLCLIALTVDLIPQFAFIVPMAII